MTAELIPNMDRYFDNEKNVLLIGLHGVGKSEAVMDFAKRRGIVCKYLSCSTLDPFTDLVGIPTPRKHCAHCGLYTFVDHWECPRCHEGLPDKEVIIDVTREWLYEAELIFADELNRSDPKTRNALFELTQFHSINGERLPKLKAVWGAINPPDSGQYQVEDLDPAYVDRFDVFINIDPKPSAEYMKSVGIPHDVARAMVAWSEGHKKRDNPKDFISPRRLVKIAQMYQLTGDPLPAIQPWADVDRNKLQGMIERMTKIAQMKGTFGGNLASGAYTGFTYNAEWLLANKDDVVAYLSANPTDLNTSQAIAEAYRNKQTSTLASHLQIINSLHRPVLESWVDSMSPGRFKNFEVLVQDRVSRSLIAEADTMNLTDVINLKQDRFDEADGA